MKVAPRAVETVDSTADLKDLATAASMAEMKDTTKVVS